jgi:outer membrane receptor protein involved in Fe transport
MVSNAPGGVVNFVSKTGKDVGNAVGVTMGLGSRLNRYDFNYGGSLGERTYFNIGGFMRQGEGGTHKTGFNSENGGQFKASLTRELDKGGYVRVNFKHLDDKTPSYMPVPVTVSNGTIRTIAGIDPRNAFFINSSLTRDTTVDRNGNLVTTNPADGLHVTSNSIGLEAKIPVGDGWTLEERFRKSTNSGRFMALFPANNGNNGADSSFTGTMFNTSLDNMDNFFNDIKLSKNLDINGGKAMVTGGLFSGSQDLAQTWFWNQYSVGMAGHNATITGPTSSGWATWGGCCSRAYDVRYTTTAPYAAFSWEKGPLTLDASLRRSQLSASGQTISGTLPAGGSTTSLAAGAWDPSKLDTVGYKISKTAYSLGGNYALNRDTAIYARLSDGVNFSADRLLYGTPGALNGKPTSFNELKQQEVGIKHRQGNLSVFGTLFFAQTKESNFEATTQKFTSNSYDAKGVEIEVGYRMGAFRLNGGVTYTNAKITDSLNASDIGKTPRRH